MSYSKPRRSQSLGCTILPQAPSWRLPVRLPRTIEDAILVVQSLGEQYLWVDALCLDSEGTSQRRMAIRAMDTIYEGALLTICGLSGIDSNSGLDGISKPLNIRPQISLTTESATYMATETVNLDRIIRESPWNSRAWTFQEGILSRRRLGFHPKGVFLWCQEELFQSMVQIDLSQNRDRNLCSDAVCSFRALGYDLNSVEWDFRTYTEIIAAYTPRKLSYSSDAENAISGVLNRLSQLTVTPFACGLPEDDLDRAVLWTEVEDEELDVGLLRRQGFPSWSWLGWDGKIEYDCWLVNPVLIELPDRVFAYNKHTLATRGMSIEPDETREIIVPTNARMRIVACNNLKIESQIARFKVVMVHTNYHLDEHIREGAVVEDSAVRPDISKQSTDGGSAWKVVDKHDNEVPIGIRYAKSSGTYFYVGSEISRRLSQVPGQTVELVFLQRWREFPGANPIRWRHFDDRAWVMIILRNPDETAERVAVTTIPYDVWKAADPVASVIHVV